MKSPILEARSKTSAQGEQMHALLSRLFPICRSITGNGVRETLKILQEYIPLEIHEIPSGTKAFDWTVPEEWNIKDAYVKDASGRRVIDFKRSNLHVVSYSEPFEGKLTLEELKKHLYTLPDQPDLIPYVTSYYDRRWGFCLSDNDLKKFKDNLYEVKIDSTLKPGSLTYGELLIKGQTEKEILISTYVCHPSLANNELSGPVVAAFLAKYLLEMKKPPRYTYRFVFIPETIGAITYISRNLEHLKKNVVGGYVVSCVGADAHFSYLQTRQENTLTDRITLRVLKNSGVTFKIYDYLQRGSDERQYNAPGVDLPIGSLMRVRYGEYPQYHTSADDLEYVKAQALEDSLKMYERCLEAFEHNETYKAKCLCEPQLGRRGLRSTLSTRNAEASSLQILHVFSYCDGNHDLIAIAEKLKVPVEEVISVIKILERHALIEKVS